MAALKNVQMGWKDLQDVLNRMIGAINGNELLEGSGIRIVDTSNGKLISVAGETTSQASGGGGGGGGGQQVAIVPMTIQAFDTSNNPISLTVMVPADSIVGASALSWQPVAVVDPATCAQSTITVLEKPSS